MDRREIRRRIVLSPEQDAALNPRSDARAWQHHLLAAGLLADLPAPMTEGPAAPIPRLRAATHELERLEDERRALSQLHGLKTGGVPNWVWALLFLSFCFGLFFANFVMVICEGKLSGQAAYEGLAEAGYMTRWLPGQGLAHGVRITIGTQEDMDSVARVLRQLAEAAK